MTAPPRRDTWKLRGDLDQALFDDFCMRTSYRFGGDEYVLGDSEAGEPFILVRKADGKRFEVEFGAEVREAQTPKARQGGSWE